MPLGSVSDVLCNLDYRPCDVDVADAEETSIAELISCEATKRRLLKKLDTNRNGSLRLRYCRLMRLSQLLFGLIRDDARSVPSFVKN